MLSQNQRIEGALLKGKRISPLGALRDYDCWALSSRIADINRQRREMGKQEVLKDMVKRNGKCFAVYYLPKEALAA